MFHLPACSPIAAIQKYRTAAWCTLQNVPGRKIESFCLQVPAGLFSRSFPPHGVDCELPLGYPPLTCRWPKPMITGRGRSFLSRLPVSPGCHDFRCRGRPATARLAAWSPLLPCFHGRPLVVVHLARYACRVQVSQCPRRPRESLSLPGEAACKMPNVFLGDSFGARFPITLRVTLCPRHWVHIARSHPIFPTAFDSSIRAPCP